MQPGFHPTWSSYLGSTFTNVSDIGANSVILSPTWHLTHQTPPVIGVLPGQDPLWPDLIQMVGQAKRTGLDVTIHPILQYDEEASVWWTTAARDDGWWQSWFDRYRTFILYHADLAAQTGASALILGDESIFPALPAGLLADGSPSGVPGNASERWERLIAEVRTHYKGKLGWFIPYAAELPPLPGFMGSFDQLYIQFSGPFASSDEVDVQEIENIMAAKMDEDILPLHENAGQEIIISINYPSVKGALDGCVELADKCLPFELLEQPAQSYEGVELSFHEQVLVYSTMLSVMNQRPWISGFYSAGYYPPVSLQDTSTSVRGKPASDVLWYWYARLLGRETP